MDKKNCKELSNAELKLYMKSLQDEFEGKKLSLRKICDEMDAIEQEYLRAKNESEIRKNLFV